MTNQKDINTALDSLIKIRNALLDEATELSVDMKQNENLSFAKMTKVLDLRINAEKISDVIKLLRRI